MFIQGGVLIKRWWFHCLGYSRYVNLLNDVVLRGRNCQKLYWGVEILLFPTKRSHFHDIWRKKQWYPVPAKIARDPPPPTHRPILLKNDHIYDTIIWCASIKIQKFTFSVLSFFIFKFCIKMCSFEIAWPTFLLYNISCTRLNSLDTNKINQGPIGPWD